VVLFGTAKNLAGLNGYTSGGKTGTAQKIDVATHRYSKTKYVASFVGIAPVNNPAISVAVIIDSPEGNHYGNVNAAPVFREVAQEVLEYLGVPHDTSLSAQTELAKGQPAAPGLDDAPSEHTGDLDALFAEVNDLPADDPLRGSGNGQQPVPSAANELASGGEQPTSAPPSSAMPPPPALPAAAIPLLAAETKRETASFAATVAAAQEPHASGHAIVVSAANRVGVPSFLGEPLRVAVETAGTAGLALQIVGSGIAREQVPAPGSMVPPGTEIVVRFSR
jgi:cell division protein FtsI (penicillin-binding protein 3)